MTFRKLSDFEKGWLSGLLDGEGSIKLRPRSNGKTFKPSIEIANNNKELLDAIQNIIPEGKIYKKEWNNENWETSYQFIIWKQESMKNLLQQLKDHLFVKRRRAELMLQFIALREASKAVKNNNGRFTESSINPEERQLYKIFMNS